MFLVLSQGQARFEHRFNISKSVTKVIISQDSVIARKLIDQLQEKDLKPLSIELSDDQVCKRIEAEVQCLSRLAKEC